MKPENDDLIIDEGLGRLLDRGLAVRPSPRAVQRVVARALAAVDRDRQAERFRRGPRRAVAAAAVLLLVCSAGWRLWGSGATSSPGTGTPMGTGGGVEVARVDPPRTGERVDANLPEPTAVAALDAALTTIESIQTDFLGAG